MDFHLTKEQLLVRKMYREFAENEVKPLAAEIDEEERFPMETVEKMAQAGHDGHLLPQGVWRRRRRRPLLCHVRGGAGQGLRHHCRYRFRSYLSVLRSHFEHGTEEQKQEVSA